MKKIIFLIAIVFLFSGCNSFKKEKPAITIDKIQISSQEFDEAFRASVYAKMGESMKKDFLETFLARKLMLKEAENMGLDTDPEFLKDIQLFWEQSLLKNVIDKKMRELTVSIRIDDSEINNFYNSHKDKDFAGKELPEVYDLVKRILFNEKQQMVIREWIKSLEKNSKINIDYKALGITQAN